MARIKAIGEITHHTKFDWTADHLSQLSFLVTENMNGQDGVVYFAISIDEVRRGWNKLMRRVRSR
jgi:hypothetical protein